MSLMARRALAPAPARASARPAFTRAAPRRSVLVRAGAEAVNDDSFQNMVLESKVPVLVSFWAPWSDSCRNALRMVDEIAEEYAGKLKCFKLDTDESPNVSGEYGLRSIPSIMIFKAGTKCATITGDVPKGTIQQTVEKYV
ncbi:Thioredoxin M-type, chloroplastic [Tetrabaena socialis]|uniref:Thioredoxin M-type, chloroplastic n=1 Tax=Tetrabaena socialis TaxID=47790 RepID=A0A2J8A7F6_9CHLO|nr:Thioredoxin M-type, chloroplastic [Tetrabaena socialis]|eukprot:PNH08469.1 Thioredoxin M-type, chloroplastic [Tetrabaena socialis]